MHQTSSENMKRFVDTYCKDILKRNRVRVLELGSKDVNGSFRSLFPDHVEYVGLDIEKGPGVDVVLSDPYSFPSHLDNSFDISFCSSCFEHSELFWLSFLEMMGVLKPEGLFYMNAPSTGIYHRYPMDCWRFYPDSGVALTNWSRRVGKNSMLLESYITLEHFEAWNDYVGVFIKDEKCHRVFPQRITSTYQDFINGLSYNGSGNFTLNKPTENMRAWVR